MSLIEVIGVHSSASASAGNKVHLATTTSCDGLYIKQLILRKSSTHRYSVSCCKQLLSSD